MRRKLFLVSLSIMVMTLLAAACSVSADTGARPTDSFAVAFARQIPVFEDERFTVAFANFEEAIDQLGISVADSCDVPGEEFGFFSRGLFDAQIQGLITTPPLLAGSWDDPELLRTTFGFDLCDVRSTAYLPNSVIGTSEYLTLINLNLDPRAIEAAVTTDPVWVDHLNVEDVNGVTLYDWGDHITRGTSSFRPLGVGGQLAVSANGGAIYTQKRDVIDHSLNADADRLAGVPGVRSMLERFEELGSFTITVTNESHQVADELAHLVELQPHAAAPWELLGLGRSVEGETGVAHLLVDHASEAEAAVNAERLAENLEQGQRFRSPAWSEAFVIDSVEQDGTLVVAKLISQTDESLLGLSAGSFALSVLLVEA